MPRKPEFHSVEFFRKVRDQQASILAGKSPEEIVAFFSKAQAETPPPDKPKSGAPVSLGYWSARSAGGHGSLALISPRALESPLGGGFDPTVQFNRLCPPSYKGRALNQTVLALTTKEEKKQAVIRA